MVPSHFLNCPLPPGVLNSFQSSRDAHQHGLLKSQVCFYFYVLLFYFHFILFYFVFILLCFILFYIVLSIALQYVSQCGTEVWRPVAQNAVDFYAIMLKHYSTAKLTPVMSIYLLCMSQINNRVDISITFLSISYSLPVQ